MKFIKKAKRGFTLVELVVVIAVIAILAAVSVGAYFGITDSANKSKLESEARGILTNIQLIANGNDSNSYMDRESIHIKTDGLQTFENKLNGMSGIEYEVTNQLVDENTEISKPTVYFIDSRETSGAPTLNASGYNQYFRFAYYTPDVGGKCAIYTFATQECKVQDASFKIGESTEDEPVTPAPIYATDFIFDPESLKLEVGDEVGWSTTPIPGDAEYTVIEGENDGVFEFVNETTKDMIRGLKGGTGTIIYKSGNFTKTFNITVEEKPVAATGITLTVNGVTNNTVTINNTINYDVVVNGSDNKDATNQEYDIVVSGLETYVLDKDVKTIKPTSKGTMNIKVTSKDGNYTDEKSIEVYAPVTDFNVIVTKGENTIEYANGIELKVGESISVEHNFGDNEPTNTNVTYVVKSVDTGVLSQNEQSFTAKTAGKSQIIVTPEDNKEKEVVIDVVISNILVEGLAFTPDVEETISLLRTSTYNLNNKVVISPSDATIKKLSYISDNPNIKIENGVVSTTTACSGTVTISTTDGSNKSISLTFNFGAILVTQINLTYDVNINLDGKTTLVATADSNADNPNLIYTQIAGEDIGTFNPDTHEIIPNGTKTGEIVVKVESEDGNASINARVNVLNKKTIYFLDQERWHTGDYKTYIYAWKDSVDNTWPGEETTVVDTIDTTNYGSLNVSSYVLDMDKYSNIIVNNTLISGSNTYTFEKTETIAVTNFTNNNFVTINGQNGNYENDGRTAILRYTVDTYVPEKYDYGQRIDLVLFCTNNPNWSNIYIHYWIEGGKGTDWPGKKMDYCYTNGSGEKIYRVYINRLDYPTISSVKIIFNNNAGTQTANLSSKVTKDGVGCWLNTKNGVSWGGHWNPYGN